MSRARRKTDLIRFLRTIQRPDRPIEDLGDDDSLVDSGLIDSLAELEIILYLEKTYGIDLAETGFDPNRLRTVTRILDLVERHAPAGEPD